MCRHCKIFTKAALLTLLCLSTTRLGAGRTLQHKQRPRDARTAGGLPVVYVQHVRRLPPEYPDDEYVEEIFEEFDFRHGPPSFTYTDEDIDRMIRCDFDPTLKECELLRKPVAPSKRPATRPTPTTYRTESTTTTRQPYVYDRRPPAAATTPRTITTTTTEYLPFLADIADITPDDNDEVKPRLSNIGVEDYDDLNTNNWDAKPDGGNDEDNNRNNEVVGDIYDEYGEEDAEDEDVENYK